MDILSVQMNTKAFMRIFTIILAFALVLSITLSNAYAVPNYANHPNASCTSTGKQSSNGLEIVECCWFAPVKPGTGIYGSDREYYCSECENGGSRGNINCSEPELQFRTAPTTGENIAPEVEGGVEQPPVDNTPPIRSDNSVFPNENSKVLDERQPTNPTFNSNKGTIIDKNLAQDQPMQFSPNDEQSQESKGLAESNNVETASNSQENDETTNSETTASLSKRGNTQNSPVPSECPKQGPIPPDCTMKPKF